MTAEDRKTGAAAVNVVLAPPNSLLDYLCRGDPNYEFGFRGLPEAGGRKGAARLVNGSWTEALPMLNEWSRQGCGIFVCVNKIKPGKRTYRRADGVVLPAQRDEDIDEIRTLAIDLDGAPLEPVMTWCKEHNITSRLVVETSPGKFHVYFDVERVPLEEFESLQRKLAKKFNGDSTICNKSRILRIPGFPHQKGTPFKVGVVSRDFASPPIACTRMVELLIDIEVEAKVKSSGAGAGNGPKLKDRKPAIPWDRPDNIKEAIEYLRTVDPSIQGEHGDDHAIVVCTHVYAYWAIRPGTLYKLGIEHFLPRCKQPEPSDSKSVRRWWAVKVKSAFNSLQNAPGAENPLLEARREFARDFEEGSEQEHTERTRKFTAGIELVRADTIQMRPVNWIWPDRLARGKHTACAGMGGFGKSQVGYDIAARLSRGSPWPFETAKAPNGSTIILQAEDAPEDILAPRLEAAGADRAKVFIVKAVYENDGKRRRFMIQRDLDEVHRKAREIGDVALLIIDPIGSYLGGELDTHKDAALRDALDPIGEVADAAGFAVFSVMHFNKSNGGSAVTKVMGSAAFVNAPRCALSVMGDLDTNARYLFGLKSNMGPLPGGLKFHLEMKEVAPGIIQPHVVWNETTSMTADALLKEQREREAAERAPARAAAAAFLWEFLEDGPRESKEVEAEAKERGIASAALRRAAEEIPVVRMPPKKPGDPWHVRLPSKDDDDVASMPE